MCIKDIETRQSELKVDGDALVAERSKLSQRISEINILVERINGAYAELEQQKAKLEVPKVEKVEVKKPINK